MDKGGQIGNELAIIILGAPVLACNPDVIDEDIDPMKNLILQSLENGRSRGYSKRKTCVLVQTLRDVDSRIFIP